MKNQLTLTGRIACWLAVLFTVLGAGAFANQLVDQGTPGNYGPWSVVLKIGNAIISATNPVPSKMYIEAPDGGIVPEKGTAAGEAFVEPHLNGKPVASTAGSVPKMTQDTLGRTSTGCVEIDTATFGLAANTVTVLANTWYKVSISDPAGSSGAVGCWESQALPPAYSCGASDAGCVWDAGALCYQKSKMFATSGAGYDDSWSMTLRIPDAGAHTILSVFVTISTPLTVTFCPEPPSF